MDKKRYKFVLEPLNLIWQQVDNTASIISHISKSPRTEPTSLSMHSLITLRILRVTTSSDETSLASNLHRATAPLNSLRAVFSSTEERDIKPASKKDDIEFKATEVIGPVERGERISARNGSNISSNGSCSIAERMKLY